MCLTCLWTPPFIHPSMLPSSLPPLTPRVPGAMLCLLKRCVVSECAACHQYGWVTEVSGSNAVHCFTPALAVPLPVHIMHAGVLDCVSMCDGMHICVHGCQAVWMCPRPCINILYVCLRVIGPYGCLGSCVYSLGHSTEGFDLCPGLPASRYNEHVATGGMWDTSAWLPLE